MAVMEYGEKPLLENVVEEDFLAPRTVYQKAYLSTDASISLEQPVASSGIVSYNSEDPEDMAKFTYTFTERNPKRCITCAAASMTTWTSSWS